MNTFASRPPLANLQLAVDIVVFTIEDDQLKALFIKRHGEPKAGYLALPGGMLWDGETTLEAATRLLKAKGGVQGVFMEQLYTFDAPDRDTRGRVVSVGHYALVERRRLNITESDQTETPALYPVSEAKKLAFDHSQIVAVAVKRLQAKLAYTNAAHSLLPDLFTLSQLQRVYEIVLGRELDKRNFRKKYLTLNLITPTDEMVSGAHRPAQLYKFVSTKPTELSEPAL